MAYEVILAPQAAKEIGDAVQWYVNISHEIAQKWYDGMLAHIHTLAEFPERCPPLPQESKKMKRNIRQLLYGSKQGQYRVLFEIKADKVNIISVRHTSRWSKTQ